MTATRRPPAPASGDPSAPAGPGQDAPPGAGLHNVALRLAYDGSAFAGWQIQTNAPSIQGAIEDALRTLLRRPTSVYGSGRTDAGVHAYAQVANLRVPAGTDLRRLQAGLNALLAPHVAVQALVPVPDDFHARHSAVGKVYRYHIQNRPYPSVFGRGRCWWLKRPLDPAAMQAAARHLEGEHDFSAFRARDCAAPSPVRTLHAVAVTPGDWVDGTLRIVLEGSGFLQHMARIIVGTLVAVGQGKLTPDDVPRILAAREREAAHATAPAHGLHLLHVRYDLARYPALAALDAV